MKYFRSGTITRINKRKVLAVIPVFGKDGGIYTAFITNVKDIPEGELYGVFICNDKDHGKVQYVPLDNLTTDLQSRRARKLHNVAHILKPFITAESESGDAITPGSTHKIVMKFGSMIGMHEFHKALIDFLKGK